MDESRQNAKAHYNNLDFLRFVFALLIVCYHLIPEINKVYKNAELYHILSVKGRVIVILFYAISGFFFYISEDYNKATFSEFALKKVKRLWPLLAISILSNINTTTDILNLLFINSGTGLISRGSSNPASWFVCNLLFIYVLGFALFRHNYDNLLSVEIGQYTKDDAGSYTIYWRKLVSIYNS